MRKSVFVSRTGLALRLALTGVAGGLLAGCANSDRLNEAFSNPFQTAARQETPPEGGGIAAPAPVSPVQSHPLSAPAPGTQQGPQTSSLAPPPDHGSAAGWSAKGGSPIVVAQGEDAQILSRRYGVPVEALVRANGFSAASQIQPGTRLVIPVYNAALAALSGAPAASKSLPKAAAKGKTLGAPPTTLAAQAKALKTAHAQEKERAKAAGNDPQQKAARAKAEKLVSAAGEPAALAKPAKQEPPQPAKAGPAQSASKPSTAAAEAVPEFRWPARGRIILGFKPGGNDGINIALPEGTSIKAAESGVVAYAGSELKGYGNLILIRHPNGFVSAYANTSEIEVKRGETVKRGQTIAKSGQSGNVSTPQLHFELRKGTKPVDPTQYLAGA